MTEQDVFDKVVHGLASQDFERCVDEMGLCVYTNEKGQHCAAGWVFIEYPEARVEEGEPSMRVINNNSVLAELVPFSSMLRELQIIHDSYSDPAHLKECLQTYASEHSLTWPE